MTIETNTTEVWETGSDPQVTTLGVITSGQNLAARTPVGQVTATGKFVEWAPGAADGSEVAVYLTAYAVDASGGDVSAQLIKAGTFNPDLVQWPGGSTALQQSLAFVGTPISLQAPV